MYDNTEVSHSGNVILSDNNRRPTRYRTSMHETNRYYLLQHIYMYM